MSKPKKRWEVIVGNIGTVYSGSDEKQARKDYRDYVDISRAGAGSAGGEPVTLMRDGEPELEHEGTLSDDDSSETSPSGMAHLRERRGRSRTALIFCAGAGETGRPGAELQF